MAPKETGGYSPAQKRKPTLFTIEDIKDLGNYFYELFERSNLKLVVYLAACAAFFDIIQKIYQFLVWLGMIRPR